MSAGKTTARCRLPGAGTDDRHRRHCADRQRRHGDMGGDDVGAFSNREFEPPDRQRVGEGRGGEPDNFDMRIGLDELQRLLAALMRFVDDEERKAGE